MCVKILSIIVILYLILDQSHATDKLQDNKKCIRCSNKEKTVYATDGTHGYIFHNECHMKKRNYERRRANKPALYMTSEKNCRSKCSRLCSLSEEKIICGKFGNTYSTFLDECSLDMMACVYGKSILRVNYAKCA